MDRTLDEIGRQMADRFLLQPFSYETRLLPRRYGDEASVRAFRRCFWQAAAMWTGEQRVSKSAGSRVARGGSLVFASCR